MIAMWRVWTLGHAGPCVPEIPGREAFLLSLRNWSFADWGLLLMESKWAPNQEVSTHTVSTTQQSEGAITPLYVPRDHPL